jgi:hypothetical protein
MTFPSFGAGEVLTATDMNAVGLWRVAGSAFAGATTFDITGFSSNYSRYRLELTTRRVDVAGAGTMIAVVRSSGTPISTGYYQGSASFSYTGSVSSLYTRNNGSDFLFGGSDSFAVPSLYGYDINAESGTGFTFQGTGYFTGAAFSLTNGGAVASATAFDRIRISFDYGTHTGSWALYGYK